VGEGGGGGRNDRPCRGTFQPAACSASTWSALEIKRTLSSPGRRVVVPFAGSEDNQPTIGRIGRLTRDYSIDPLDSSDSNIGANPTRVEQQFRGTVTRGERSLPPPRALQINSPANRLKLLSNLLPTKLPPHVGRPD